MTPVTPIHQSSVNQSVKQMSKTNTLYSTVHMTLVTPIHQSSVNQSVKQMLANQTHCSPQADLQIFKMGPTLKSFALII